MSAVNAPDVGVQVFVSGGSNIDAEQNLRDAVIALREEFGELTLSSVYRSPAVGFEGDDFLNVVVAFVTERSAEDCATVMNRLEAQSGRTDDQRGFTARPLDLDMVLYGDLVDDSQLLRVPRADVDEYDFVLGPLAEIAPEFRHPVSGKTMAELWEAFDRSSSRMTKAAISL